MEDFGLYIILTQPQLPHTVIAEKCVEHGIKMLQLREKHLPDRELIKIAKDLRGITRGTKTQLVIDDRADIAAICGADFLHIGQSDMTIEDARTIVGDMQIGFSTHSIAQAKQALQRDDLAYIGFGPIYVTTTKAIPDNPVGTALLKEVLSFAHIPVVAIGGLFPENIKTVLDAGAKNYCLVRHFMQTLDFEGKLNEFKELIK